MSDKIKDIDFILETIDRNPVFIADETAYKNYLYNANIPVLYTDNKDNLINYIVEHSVLTTAQLTEKSIEELKDIQRVQKRLSANRYFAGGTATARVPYLLTGKAFCAHCNTAMVSDGGTSRTGQQHHYYACKAKKKGVCEKRREDKDGLELYVTQLVYDFLSEEKNVKVAVRDTLAYYEKRTGLDSIKSLDGKIAKAQKDIDEMTTAFIEAKNALLRANIEKRMNDYEKLIEDLQEQKKQLERERGRQFTEKDLFDFIAELIKGDPNDKEYQKKLIDNFVVRVYVGDDYVYTQLNLANANDAHKLRLEEMKNALEHLRCVQTQSPLARQKTKAMPSSFFYAGIRTKPGVNDMPGACQSRR